MALPNLLSLPPADIRISLPEWDACSQTYLTLVDLYLRLPTRKFELTTAANKDLTLAFIRSFYHEAAHTEVNDTSFTTSNGSKLRHACLLLLRRLCLDTGLTHRLLDFDLLSDVCNVHRRSTTLSKIMAELWKAHGNDLTKMMLNKKASLTTALDSESDKQALADLERLARIMLASPEIAAVFMTGSDFLDALASTYNTTTLIEDRKIIAAIAYLGLHSLVKVSPPNLSLLTDHLYSLKTQADGKPSESSLLADLVTNTLLLSKLKLHTDHAGGERLLKLLDVLATYRSTSVARPKKRLHPTKGKAPAKDNEMHVHRYSLVTQVQDLFPDLGSGFVLKLLDEYRDDVEQVTAHLLDDSLPPHLRDIDRNEKVAHFDTTEKSGVEHLAPKATPHPSQSYVPHKRNVFDDDELDRLEVDASRLHVGKRSTETDRSQPNKAAILSALAAFDSDDDERDDTYDVEDVGGTVDTAHPDGEPGPTAKVTQEENDMALLTAYRASPDLFARGTDARRGQARQALKSETGMTDEAIEGWAIMLQRDPKRLRRLEAQLGGFDGHQTELGRVAYREGAGETETDDSDTPAGRGGFGPRARGWGRGRGGRGRGDVAGPSNNPDTATAQRRKEASKGSRANHNRRDQRAKKMARGGFGP